MLTVPRRVVETGHWEKEASTKPARFDVAADALRVIKASRKRDHRPQGKDVFWGYLMGAAVALQTLPKDSRVEAAVLLAPFADLSQVMRHHSE